MKKQKKKEQSTQPTFDNTGLMTADIPVKISLVYKNEKIFEFNQVIDIAITTDNSEGNNNGAMLVYLKQEMGLSTEDALFAMAQKEFMENEKYIASKLKFPNLHRLEGSHELDVQINRNGEIKYRKLIKG